MKIYMQILCAVGFQLTTMSALASNFNYNYFQIGYTNTDIDLEGANVDGSSISLSGSFAVNQKINAVASLQTGNYDFDLDTDLFGIGLGFHNSLSSSTDLVFEALLLDAQVDTESLGRSDDTGYSAEAGLRYSTNANVELNASIEVIDLYDDTESMLSIGTLIKFDNERSFILGYSKGDNTRNIELAFRMEF
ncbi:MAG: hypothetical protein IPM20_07775 [Gammaproteobacteria bacterium]|nr:hypothetical protein [Gammaproteobacteria bacterium]